MTSRKFGEGWPNRSKMIAEQQERLAAIDPGPGWALLKYGAEIKPGDEVWCFGIGPWTPVGDGAPQKVGLLSPPYRRSR